MFRIVSAFISLLFAVFVVGDAQAHSCGDAQVHVDKAIAYFDQAALTPSGREALFAEFSDRNNSKWNRDALYIVVLNKNGVIKAHGTNPKLTNNPDIVRLRDINGVLIVPEILRVGQESPSGGWASYVWVNPETQRLGTKKSWVKAHDDLLFLAGCYQ